MLALMAIETHSFTVTSPLKNAAAAAARAPLRMSSYDEQMKAYQQQPPPHASPPANGAEVSSPTIPTNPNPYPAAPASAAATANGADNAASIIAAAAAAAATEALNNRYQQLPPPVPAPAPVAPVVSTPPPAPVAVTETAAATATANNPLGNFGTLFLGLPLWLILSYAVFFNNPTNPVINNAPPQITATNQIVLPDSIAKSAASPSGVVVLSQPITKTEVRGLFDLWNDALATGDPATVAKRYGKDGVLLPTLSDVPRTDVEGIKDYFVGFLKKRPVGKILEGEIYVGNNWAQDAGKKNE